MESKEKTPITIRKATVEDIHDLVQLRRLLFEAMGETDLAKLNAADQAAAAYFEEALPTGAFHAWLGVTPSGWPVAGGGLVVDQHVPSPGNLSGQVAYIMNMVTRPDYRRQGLARRLMQAMLQWINAQGISKVALQATEDGEPLYRSFGFKNDCGMYLDLAYQQETSKP